MAKQPYNVTPYLKNFQVYSDFSGGINARDTSDNMRDSEFRHILNGDIIERGAVSKRKGMNYAYFCDNFPKSFIQGFYRYEYGGKVLDFWFSGGGVYKVDVTGVDFSGDPVRLQATKLDIHKKNESGEWVFDKGWYTDITEPREVSCVQKDGNVYMFTGHVPLMYVADKDLVGYMPSSDITPIQATKMGYNLLADDPMNALKNGVSPTLIAEGISTDKQVGVVNTNTKFTAWISCPTNDLAKVMIRWDVKEEGDEDYKTVINWRKFVGGEYRNQTLSRDGAIDVRVYLCYEGEEKYADGEDETKPRTIWKSAVLPNYQFKMTDENKPLEKLSVKTCNKVFVHRNKLLVWGSTAKDCQDKVFISATDDYTYFPHYHYLAYETATQEPVQTVVPMFSNLMVFTKSKVFKTSGYSALNPLYFDVAPGAGYEVELANTSYGTVAPKSVKSIGNELYFLSTEGVARIRALSGSGDKYMVDLIDKKIRDRLPHDNIEDAVASRWSGHYSLFFPQHQCRWNLNIDYATWTFHQATDAPKPVRKGEFDVEPEVMSDTSYIRHPFFVHDVFVKDGVLFGVSKTTGALVHYNADWGWDGNIPFKFQLITKDFSFGLPFHYKKYKELFVLAKHGRQVPSKLKLSIESDKGTLLSNTKHTIKVNEETNVVEYLEEENSVGNVALNGITRLDVWEVGLSYFPGLEYAFTHRLRFSGKAHSITVSLEETSVNTFSLYGLGFTYKMKKPKA